MGPNRLTLPDAGNFQFATKTGAAPGSLLLSDQNKLIILDNSSDDVIFTIEQDSVTDLPVSSYFYAVRLGTGQVTVVRGGVVVFDTDLGDVDIKIDKAPLAGAWGSMFLAIKKSANLWWIFGPIKSAV